MVDRIKSHIETLFKDAPATRRVDEAREELLAGCLDKYTDLTAAGKTPEEAYIAVISGIGDVEELLRAIEHLETERAPGKEETQRRKRAFFIAMGIFLFVLGTASAPVLQRFVAREIAGAAFLVITGLAIFVLVYGVISTRVRVSGPSASLSGEIQKQLTEKSNGKLQGAVASSMWSLLVMIYLFVGFAFGWWHPSWIIFPIGVILQILIKTALGKKGLGRKNIYVLLWMVCTVTYLVVSFITELWNVTWMIFPLTLCVHQVVRLARVWRETDET